MADEYTPTTDQVRKPFFLAGNGEAFDRWLAAHEVEVRERIAQDIKADRENVPTLVLTTKGQQAAWQIGMAHAFTIARGVTR